jgi:membrane associated rhomboid family serine protease
MSVTPTPATAPDAGASRQAGFVLVAVMVVVMWAVEVIDRIDDGGLDRYGIQPRDLDGLRGVVLSPFLHGSWAHLEGNTIPFAVLGVVIALGGLARVAAVTIIIMAVGGLGTWLIAPAHTVTIGASGVVFGYAAYLVARGIASRRLLDLGVGVAVLVFYGSSLWLSLVPTPGVSWQAHVCGAIGGIAAVRLQYRLRAGGRALPGAAAPGALD